MARRKSWAAITNTSHSLSIQWILVLWGSTLIRCLEHHSAVHHQTQEQAPFLISPTNPSGLLNVNVRFTVS